MNNRTASATRSMRSDISEDRYKEKREEVNKTIKEREYLQRKTNEMIQAM